jgi:hypothetical protein
MNLYERHALKLAKDRAYHWEQKYNVQVTVEPPLLTVRFPDGETLTFRFRWSPDLHGVEWLAEDLRALDKAPGWYVRAKALARNGEGHT